MIMIIKAEKKSKYKESNGENKTKKSALRYFLKIIKIMSAFFKYLNSSFFSHTSLN